MPETAEQPDGMQALGVALQRSAQATGQRRALLLSGTADWTLDAAQSIARAFSPTQQLWLSTRTLPGQDNIAPRQAGQQLGSERDLVVYDAHGGLDADAFAAISGVIRGGGLLLILSPPLAQWPSLPDPEAERFFTPGPGPSRFIQRFIDIARQARGVFVVEQGQSLPTPPIDSAPPRQRPTQDTVCRSEDQAEAMAAILKVARGHRRRPLVLISDRGRGKSSALGIAAAQLLQDGLQRIVVTAPRMGAVAPVFEHAHRLLPGSRLQRGCVETDQARLEYWAPDELIARRPETDLLLVDEAAAIPAPMLEQLLSQHARVVFATTVHGYEGTGRGFALRFNRVLDRQTPGWRQLRLRQAIRWAEDDPLEAFVFGALLLDAGIADAAALSHIEPQARLEASRVQYIPADRLMQDADLLSQVFGLLVLAHYRTRPNDLRQLLDSPAVQLYCLRHDDIILGVALLVEEGGLAEALATRVYLGQRRLSGHLLPQSLTYHAGIRDAARLRYLRLMRIAIHPLVQGQGLGSRLLQAIVADMDPQRHDCLGTSFGLSADLLRFWRRLGFVPARLGLMREHSSGSHALIMLRGLSAAGQELARQARMRMQVQLPALLSDPLRDFDAELAGQLLSGKPPPSNTLDDDDWQDLIAFAFGQRGYEFSLAAIAKLVDQAAGEADFMAGLEAQQRHLLMVKVIQRRSWEEVVAACRLSGRAAAIQLLRTAIQQLVVRHCPADTLAALRRSLQL